MKRMAGLAVTLIAVGFAVAGCGASSGNGSAGPSASSANTGAGQRPASGRTTVRLIWSHNGKSFGELQVLYVARVTNPGGTPASVALNVRALDSGGTIVGSSQETLPNIPSRSQFDYFGELGGGGASGAELTGTPVKIIVTKAANAFGLAGSVELPMLKTSEVTLRHGNADTFTDAPYSYNLSAKVTNTTGQVINGGVTQQVVLYDRAGHVVGGNTGSSDNVPQSLPAGLSYREQQTGIPAVQRATRVAYTVWPAA